MPKIIVTQPFKFAHHGYLVEEFNPAPDAIDTTDECAAIAVGEGWAVTPEAAAAAAEAERAAAKRAAAEKAAAKKAAAAEEGAAAAAAQGAHAPPADQPPAAGQAAAEPTLL